MSFLLEKSQANLIAAQVLHEKGIYAAVPHCAYYSCLQRMKYELCVQFGVFCNDEGHELQGMNTHELIKNRLIAEVKHLKLLDENQIRNLRSYLKELKSKRKDSDYKHMSRCTEKVSTKSLKLANQINSLLNILSNHE